MIKQSLEYTILKKEEYSLAEGKIEQISQKNSNGILVYSQNFNLNLNLKLKSKAIIQAFQIKTLSKNKFTFELIGQMNKIHQTVTYSPKEQTQYCIIEVRQSYQRRNQINLVKVQVQSLEETNGVIALGYILIRGEKCQQTIKNRSISRPLQDNQFSEPKIQKQFKSGASKIIQKKQNNGSALKKNKHNEIQKLSEREDQQLKKVLQLSKRQEEERKQKENSNHKQSKDFFYVNQQSNGYNSKQRNYNLIDYEKCKSIFQHVNQTWIAAQHRAQKIQKVLQSQKLSKIISENISIKKTNKKKR